MNEDKTHNWLHRAFLLNEEELADPNIAISNFLGSRSLPAHREILWSVLKSALSNLQNQFTTAEEVADWVIYYHELLAFVEASFELHNRDK